MPAGTLTLVAPATARRGTKSKTSKAKAKKAVDKKQNKRLKAIEKALKESDGWIDSFMVEQTVNRTAQMIARGQQASSASSSFFSIAAGVDSDHGRAGNSIRAKRIKGHLTLAGRGDAAGYPPANGNLTTKNELRLLGVVYATKADYDLGLGYVLENSVAIDAQPCRHLDSFYKKNSIAKWNKWLDKRITVPYSTGVTRVNINYKVPARFAKMTYDTASLADPETNIFVLYLLGGIRDNTVNNTTCQGVFRCVFEK